MFRSEFFPGEIFSGRCVDRGACTSTPTEDVLTRWQAKPNRGRELTVAGPRRCDPANVQPSERTTAEMIVSTTRRRYRQQPQGSARRDVRTPTNRKYQNTAVLYSCTNKFRTVRELDGVVGLSETGAMPDFIRQLYIFAKRILLIAWVAVVTANPRMAWHFFVPVCPGYPRSWSLKRLKNTIVITFIHQKAEYRIW